MKQKVTNLIWGIILILAGIVFLAQNLGYIDADDIQTWTIVFAVGSVLFFICYFINGVREWGWLFPALFSAALAGILLMVDQNVEGTLMGALIMVSVAIPFWVAFLVAPKQNRWALIPAWALTAITAIIFFAERVPGEVIGTIVLLAVALPFLLVYLLDRRNWWALIPGGIVGVVAIIPLITLLGDGDWVAPLVLFLMAVPFVVVVLLSKQSWWAILPAGFLLTVCLTSIAAFFLQPASGNWAIGNGVFFLGIGATFGVLWLLRSRYDTAWAKIPAIVLLVIGVVSATIQDYWPVLIIAAGLWTLYLALRPKKKSV